MTLIRKLNWRSHLRKVQIKADRLMSAISAVARNTWGLSSEATGMIYKGVIEPVVLYGVEVWHPALRYQWARKLITRIQRTAKSMYCILFKSYRSVSADALCIISNTLPLTTSASFLANFSMNKKAGTALLTRYHRNAKQRNKKRNIVCF